MKETILSIAKWHEETFPDTDLQGQLTKFQEETDEYAEDQSLAELADMFIVASGMTRFDNMAALGCFAIVADLLSKHENFAASVIFAEEVQKKMAKNRSRTWEKTPQGNYHHTNEEA